MGLKGTGAKVDFKSIKVKLLIGLLIVMLPLIALMVYSSNYSSNVVRKQVAQSNQNLISLYLRQIDQNLNDINKYLFNVASQDMNLLSLERREESDPDSYNLSKIRLLNQLSNNSVDNASIDYYIVYSTNNNDLMFAPGSIFETDYNEREKTIEAASDYILHQAIAAHYKYAKWQMIQLNGKYFLFQIIRTGEMYIGGLIDQQKLDIPLTSLDFGKSGHAFFVSEHKEPISSSSFINFAREHHLNFNYRVGSYTLTGKDEKYLLVGDESKQGNFSLVVMMQENEVLKRSPLQQRIVVFTAGGTLFIILFSLIFIRKTILLPLNMIVRGLRRLRDGDFETRITLFRTASEFALMHQSFNSLASEIQELKINVYEEKLKHQQAELKHLQLQINPHFFLNSLNIIYYLAQVKDYTLIQDMSLSLIQYFRFMFRSNSDFVSLQDEIKHTDNYLRIQELRFPDNLGYHMSIPDELLKCLVPPLVVQSFVENSIKHAQSMDKFTHIEIMLTLDESSDGEPRIRIRIQDTGAGFPEEVLHLLRRNGDLSRENGHHIGIWNMRRRLDLLYHDQAELIFSNASDYHGAVVEILLPLRSE